MIVMILLHKTHLFIFSTKRVKPIHPPLLLENGVVTEKAKHKGLGMILDSKLDLQSHIKEAILKARQGIGLMRHISNCVIVNRIILEATISFVKSTQRLG